MSRMEIPTSSFRLLGHAAKSLHGERTPTDVNRIRMTLLRHRPWEPQTLKAYCSVNESADTVYSVKGSLDPCGGI